jgi:leucyl aminopeptidase
MDMTINFKKTAPKADFIVLPLGDTQALSPLAAEIDAKSGGLLTSAIANSKGFKGKMGQFLSVHLPSSCEYKIAVLAGFGVAEDESVTYTKIQDFGGKIFAQVSGLNLAHGVIEADFVLQNLSLKHDESAARLGFGVLRRSYRFDQYKSKKDKKDKEADVKIKTIDIVTKAESDTAFKELNAINSGIFWARDLVNLAPNDLYPESYAQRIKDECKPLGIAVTIFDDKKLEKMGAGGILAVGKGSERKPCMVILHWKGKNKSKDSAPIALVGKGVTFDTGGISIKPAANMDEMKNDMGGSAAVVGAMKALALMGCEREVIGLVGLVENMPSHNAYRPGDILTSLSGKTVEVLNTDAEGRLVLMDVLHYAQDKYKPALVVDLATLTGAIVVALGQEYAGLYANDEKVWDHFQNASLESGEKIWRMPLDEAFRQDVKSEIADLKNIGSGGKAGSCTAAAFLQHFIKKDQKWVHIDIAGTAFKGKNTDEGIKGATGYGVHLLTSLVQNY